MVDKTESRFLLEEMIRLTAKTFMTHKKSESQDDCQDAWHQNDQDGRIERYAVADGATRSFFPKEWADLLVEHFCEAPDPSPNVENWKTWLKPIQDKWHKKAVDKVKAHPIFFLVNSLNSKEPATSTFIGLEFDKVQGRWQAMIVGDSCLFHIGSCGFRSYMIGKSADFTSRPEVLASYEKDNHSEPDFIHGDAEPGDTLILATDALAKWILEHEELGRREKALNQFKLLQTNDQFQKFVDCGRTNENLPLVNDDVALMMILVESAEHVEAEEQQPVVRTPSGWELLAGLLGFVVGGLISLLIYWLTKD